MKKKRYIIPETAVVQAAVRTHLLDGSYNDYADAKENPFGEAPADENNANTEEDGFTWGNVWSDFYWE